MNMSKENFLIKNSIVFLVIIVIMTNMVSAVTLNVRGNTKTECMEWVAYNDCDNDCDNDCVFNNITNDYYAFCNKNYNDYIFINITPEPIYTWTNQVNRSFVEEIMSLYDWSNINTDQLSSIRFDHWRPRMCSLKDTIIVDDVMIQEGDDSVVCPGALFIWKEDSRDHFLEAKIEIFTVLDCPKREIHRRLRHELFGHLYGYRDYDNRTEEFAVNVEWNVSLGGI